MGQGQKIWVLMLCLGNICRSPMAEAVFQDLVEEEGLGNQIKVDSAGTGAWHVGERAHRGTLRTLAKHGIRYEGRARQIDATDIRGDHTFVFAMDQQNLRDFQGRFGDFANLYRLMEFGQQYQVQDVPDPYYQGNFDEVYDLVSDGCRGALKFVRNEAGL